MTNQGNTRYYFLAYPNSLSRTHITKTPSSQADDGAQSYALKEYLRAAPTIVDRCSGAISDGQGKKKGKGRGGKAFRNSLRDEV